MRSALIMLLFAIVACSSKEPIPLTEEQCQTTLCCTACKPVNVGKTIDGDTIDSSEGRIRLFGINAPEKGDRCYREATSELRKLSGNRVRVESGPRSKDNFQRSLYYAYTESGDSIDELLIERGFAEAWRRDGQHKKYLMQVQKLSQQSGLGCLWK